jgi:hypothetical protein
MEPTGWGMWTVSPLTLQISYISLTLPLKALEPARQELLLPLYSHSAQVALCPGPFSRWYVHCPAAEGLGC